MSMEKEETAGTGHPGRSVPAAAAETAALQGTLDRALREHQAGNLERALAGYRQILQRQPGHALALHMSGVIAYQTGEYGESINLISRAAQRMAPDPGLCVNLGNALQASGRITEAVEQFRKAAGLAPGLAVAWNNLGNALRLQGRHGEAVEALHQALCIDDRYTDGWVNLAIACQEMHDLPAAIRAYEQALALEPDHGGARHMLAAMRGEQTDAAPAEHVARLFDGYAARFDHHLVETLGYSMPRLLRAEIDRLSGPAAHFARVIDLGCGTGLAGVEFRPVAGHLGGVDLSAAMISRARERAVYDELRVGDLVTCLAEDPAGYDLFICADVFPYIGRVDALFAAIAARAAPGARFAFSTERHEGEGFALRPSARFAHAEGYLRAAADRHGFTVQALRTENLRKQQGAWIPGDLVVLQRRRDRG